MAVVNVGGMKSTFEWRFYKPEISEGTSFTRLDSPYFSTGPEGSFQWKLQLNKTPVDNSDSQYVLLNLYLVTSNAEKIKVKYDFSLKHGGSANTIDRSFAVTSMKGVKVLKIPDDSAIKDLKFFPTLFFNQVFHVTDTLLILCEIDLEVVSGKDIWKCQNKGIPGFEELLDDPEFNDVTLETSSESFRVNKKILSARSPVFRAMFEHDMKEKIENAVTIPDIDSAVMREMLRYIYCGRVESFERAIELYAAADKYQINALKMECLEILCDDITVENAGELYVFASSCSHEGLITRITRFIMDNIKEILAKSGLDSLQDVTLLRNLFNKAIAEYVP